MYRAMRAGRTFEPDNSDPTRKALLIHDLRWWRSSEGVHFGQHFRCLGRADPLEYL
jgi:hypothetical protein